MKKSIVLILSVVVLLTVLCACDGQTEQKEYIGIVSAMDNEIAVLLGEAQIDRVDVYGGVEYHVGRLRGKNVVISRSGIGKVRASAGVTAMFNRYSVSKVIFTGIAGGLKDDTQVLDLVIATDLVEHDYGILSNDGFTWCSGDPGMGGEEGERYLCDRSMVELAYRAAVDVMGQEHVHKGTIATGDQFIASEEYVRKLRTDYDACACEMEGASVAVICGNYGKPFVVIRALSDKADGNAHDSYEGFGDLAAAHSADIVLEMLESLS